MSTLPQVARISLKNILVPTDFSSASEDALGFALALSKMYDATILMAHVLPPKARLQVVADRLPAQDDRDWQKAQENLGERTHRLSLENTRCRALLGRGDLAQVIPAMIEENSIDMVIVGTHGRRGVSKIVLGSGAEKIYRAASCPVMTVGPEAEKRGLDWKPFRILCPVDTAGDPETALHYALSLAEENEGQMIVLQAVPMVPWQHRVAVEKETQQVLESLIPPEARCWCTADLVVRWEHPVEAIVRAAEEREVDLIVMGVRQARSSGLSSHLPWPVASEVVSRAPCPVVTVRV